MKVLLTGGLVVTCDGEDLVFRGDVLLGNGKIEGLFPEGQGSERIPGPLRMVDASGCAITPGLVQGHVHLCQTLFRGMADDMPLLEWLKERIWPLEAAHDDPSALASAQLALLEMMLAGTTTVLDMGTVHAQDAIFEACLQSGIRGFSGKAMMDQGLGIPTGLAETTEQSLRESEALEKRWSGAGQGRLGYAYAPRFILSCSENLFRGVAERAAAGSSLMHTHAAEHPGEVEAVRTLFGCDDVDALRRWGIRGPKAVYAHGVQLTDTQARTLAEDGTRVVHCPSANLKLGSGIARIADLDNFGVPLALGADGAPCNNNLDPWVEMRHAALLAKVRTGVTSLPAKRAFRLATIDGARALGLGATTGSLEVGKKADVVVVSLDTPHALPGGDVYSRLVYACQARDVRHVFVDGAWVVRFGEHQQLDAGSVRETAMRQAEALVARCGIEIPLLREAFRPSRRCSPSTASTSP